MGTAKVHRHLAKSQEWLGLEPIDALALGLLTWILVTFNAGALLINLCVVCAGYAALRIAKRGKPAGYTTALVKYTARSRRALLTGHAIDRDGRRHPWPHSSSVTRAAVAARPPTAPEGAESNPDAKQ